MKKNKTYRLYLLLIGILGAVLLSACQGEELMTDTSTASTDAVAEARPLIQHQVSVALDGAATRVAYKPSSDGLQLSWQAEETLGVYIYNKTNSTYTYAGSISSTGTEGDRGVRYFTGTVRAKRDDETYVYLHPALAGETQGSAAQGTINLTPQSAPLGSTTHLSSLIPLIWHEGSPFPTYHGYALHLSLAFNEDPGTITSVTLQTMDGVGTTAIFPTTFKAATMKGGSTKNSTITLSTSGTAKKHGSVWTADAYLACTNVAEINVFRTKFNVKVETESNGTFYNEYRSFPGQETAPNQKLPMLANGKCYNLGTTMSKDAAPTIISTQYKVNSLLGMWDEYGKSTDPFHLVVYAGGEATLPADGVMPQQLKDNKTAILTRYQNNAPGTPTWLGPAAGSLYSTGYTTAEELKQADVTINNILITQPTEVFVTFISEFGWNENLLGYYYYNMNNEPESSGDVTKTIIFPNVSKPNHQPFNLGGTGTGSTTTPANIGSPDDAPLREFETVKLLYTDAQGYSSTIFPAGTTIGFMMMIDTEAQETSPKSGYDLLKWSQWRLFTNTKWNAANSKWLTTYANNNFFASGDVCKGSGTPIPGLAIYGVKDNATNTANTAYGAMIFMVSTKVPEAMKTANKAYFNIGTGAQVIEK